MPTIVHVRRLDGRMDPIDLDPLPYYLIEVHGALDDDEWAIAQVESTRIYVHPDSAFECSTHYTQYRGRRPGDGWVHPSAGRVSEHRRAEEMPAEIAQSRLNAWRRRRGIGQPEALVPCPPVSAHDLSATQKNLLRAAVELEAFDLENATTGDEISTKAGYGSHDNRNVRRALEGLKNRGFLMAKPGAGGGHWITPEGRTALGE